MIIENGDSKFTEEEKRNLVVREYTSEEIQQNKKAYVNKSTKKCFPLIVLIVLCSIYYPPCHMQLILSWLSSFFCLS